MSHFPSSAETHRPERALHPQLLQPTALKPVCDAIVSLPNGPVARGTLGRMHGSGAKAIEEVCVGDTVWAWDESADGLIERPVVRLYKHSDKPLVAVCLDCEGRQEVIEATTEHPFWVPDRGWVPASDLMPGDGLLRLNGSRSACVVSVACTGRTADVFNFEVDETHNYFVGSDGVLVHNSSGPEPTPSLSSAERALLAVGLANGRVEGAKSDYAAAAAEAKAQSGGRKDFKSMKMTKTERVVVALTGELQQTAGMARRLVASNSPTIQMGAPDPYYLDNVDAANTKHTIRKEVLASEMRAAAEELGLSLEEPDAASVENARRRSQELLREARKATTTNQLPLAGATPSGALQHPSQAQDSNRVPSARYVELPAARGRATGQHLATRVAEYAAVHDPNFVLGMTSAIDKSVSAFTTRLKEQGRVSPSEVWNVLRHIGIARRSIQMQKIQRSGTGAPLDSEAYAMAQEYGKPLPTDNSMNSMWDYIQADNRHSSYMGRAAAWVKSYRDSSTEITLPVGGANMAVPLSTVIETYAHDFIVIHPTFGQSRILASRAAEIFSEVLSTPNVTEKQGLSSIAEANYLMMHGTPFMLGSPSCVESLTDAVLRARFGKTLPEKAVGVEPFWEAIFSPPGESGLNDFVDRYRRFYED